jgi:hypothetical protein
VRTICVLLVYANDWRYWFLIIAWYLGRRLNSLTIWHGLRLGFGSGSHNFAPSILAHPLLLFPDGHDVDKCLDKKGLRAVVVAPRWWSQP